MRWTCRVADILYASKPNTQGRTTIENNQIKTPSEIAALKMDWKQDPCWDIEDTEGFEAHYDELKAFSLEMRAIWKREYDQREAKERKALEEEAA